MRKSLNKYSILIFFYGFLITPISTKAQVQRAKGFIFNASEYRKKVERRGSQVENMSNLPIRSSLRAFCPTPQDQGAEPSCTAWATAYGAMTIQQARQRKVHNQKEVDKIANSKSFIFNQLKTNDPAYIPSVEKTFSFLKKYGTCLAATFLNDVPTTEKPDDLAMREAQDYRIEDVTEVFNPDKRMSVESRCRRLKKILADSTPIIVGLRLPFSFSGLKEKVFRYDPKEMLDSSAHALCLVGYDDQDSTFELMNSWGTNWGDDNGFVRIHYADMVAMMCCAYTLETDFSTEPNPFLLRGATVLRRSAGYNAKREPRFEEVRVRYDTVQKQYKTIQPHWQLGSSFQLALREVPSNWWVCVFDINQQGDVIVFHNDTIGGRIVEKIIPHDDRKLELDEKGTDLLCVLYTKGPLSNFQESLQKIVKNNTNSMQEQVSLFFKNQFSNNQLFTPAVHRMGFTMPTNSKTEGVLMFLKIETQ